MAAAQRPRTRGRSSETPARRPTHMGRITVPTWDSRAGTTQRFRTMVVGVPWGHVGDIGSSEALPASRGRRKGSHACHVMLVAHGAIGRPDLSLCSRRWSRPCLLL